MKRNLLKQGDKVVMHTCLESEGKNYGKIWTCRSDEFTKGEGVYAENVVFLEGFSGYFTTEYLQKINITDDIPEEIKEQILNDYAEDLYAEFAQVSRFEGKITLKDIEDILQIGEDIVKE